MKKETRRCRRLPAFCACLCLSALVALAAAVAVWKGQEGDIYTTVASITQSHDYSSPDEEFANRTLIVKAPSGFGDDKADMVVSNGDIHICQYGTKQEAKAAYKRLVGDRSVKYVEPDMAMGVSEAIVDGAVRQLPEGDAAAQPMVASHTYQEMPIDSRDIIVAVLDTGLDGSRMDNERVIDTGLNYSNTGTPGSTKDDNGHGTQMASIILAGTNAHVKVMPVKVLNADGLGSLLSVYSGIEYAIEHGADIINLSMTSYSSFDSQLIREAIKKAKKEGIQVVTAAGNNGADISGHAPANVGEAIVVSAINTDLTLSSYSNYGAGVDFCSYGTMGAYGLGGRYVESSGTSTACANVSAAIANLKVFHDAYGYEEMYDVMKGLALDLGEEGCDSSFGWGLLTTGSVAGIYESEVCDRAGIFSCDWRKLTDVELDSVILDTTEVNLSCWLQLMDEEERRELLARDTQLSQSRRTLTTDGDMNILSDETYTYSDYLLGNDFTASTAYITAYKNFSGYYDLVAKVNTTSNSTKTYGARIYLEVTNRDSIGAYYEDGGYTYFSGKPAYRITMAPHPVYRNPDGFIKFADDMKVTAYDLDSGQGYNAWWVIGCMFDFGSGSLPAHYCLSGVDNDIENGGLSARVEARTRDAEGKYTVLVGGEYNHTNGTDGITCEVVAGTNACGITALTGDGRERHNTATFTFDRCYSAVCVDPNGGSYDAAGKKHYTYGDSDRVYYYAPCGRNSLINTPTKDYHSFDGYKQSALDSTWFTRHGSIGYDYGNGWHQFVHEGSFCNLKDAEGNRAYAAILTAQWKPNTLKVTYDTGGGTEIEPTRMAYGGTRYALSDKKPSRDYYAFVGWTPILSANAYDSSVTSWTRLASSHAAYPAETWAGAALFNVVDDYKQGDKSVSLYARYVPNALTIQYCDKDGSIKATQTMKYSPAEDKASLLPPKAADEEGKEFVGWGRNGAAAGCYGSKDSMSAKAWAEAFGTSLKDGDATVKVYPCYKALPVYTITLDDNGGSGGSGAIYERHGDGFYKESSCTNVATEVKVPVREGYDFQGYFRTQGVAKTPDIKSTGSLSGVSNTKFAEDTTLQARWNEKVYNITYHSNYDTDGMKETQEKTTKKHFTAMPAKGPELNGSPLEKKDHHFLGWSTDRKAAVPEYREGDSLPNADLNLYVVWEKDVLEADIGADEADNPGRYHDPELDDGESDGFWYKDSVTVKATGFCNYAPIANVYLCEPMKEGETLGNPMYKGPNGQDWYTKNYEPVDMDGDNVTDDAVRLQSQVRVNVTDAADGKESNKRSKIRKFYIDTEPPFVDKYDFGRTYDATSDSYTVRVNIYDYQSGVAEAVLQENNPAGTWSDIRTMDLRIYSNSRSAEYTTEDFGQAKFTSLPVNRTDYSRKYRVACRDAVGHESHSREFTLAPELKLKSSIRKINGTSAPAGEELELLQYGNMYTWADVSTEGYAEQLLYAVPKCIHMSEGSHVQLTDSSQLDPLPLEESVRNNYKDKFDRYNFYIISTTNDAEGKAADTFAMECDEPKLELKKTYDIYVYALRGEDCKRNVLKIKYLHKLTARRVIISQSWQKPTFNWNEDTWFGWMMKQMEEAEKKKKDKK